MHKEGERYLSKILVVGSLNMDFVIDVENMPKAGETILGKGVSLVPGGKGANQAYAVGKLGGDVAMIGAVGKDVYGDKLIDNLKSVGVNVEGIERLDDAVTGNAFITVDEKGENSITVIQGANAVLNTEIIDKHIDLIKECKVVIMQLEIPLEVVSYVKTVAKCYGKKVILDPAPAKSDLPEGFLSGFDIVKPNETELQTLLSEKLDTTEELTDGAKRLRSKGIETVIVTLGGDGSLLVTEDGSELFEAQKVKAVDTTAAGDSFTAAFALQMVSGYSYEESIRFGNRVSAIAVTRKGAQTSIPTMEEVKELFYDGGKND